MQLSSFKRRSLERTLGILLGTTVVLAQAELRDAQAVDSRAPTLITNLAQLRRLTRAQAGSQPRLHLQGQVTHFDPQWGALFLSEGIGHTYVGVTNRTPSFLPGQWVEVDGIAKPGLIPQIATSQIRIIRDGVLPDPPQVSLDDLIGPRFDCQRVVVHAIIHSLQTEYNRLLLDFGDGSGRFRAHLPGYVEPQLPTQLLHARVALTGVVGAFFNPQDQSRGTRLYLNSLADVRILEPGPSDVFAEPAVTLKSISLAPPSLSGLTKVRGVLTLVMDGHHLCVQDGTNGLWIRALPPANLIDTNGLHLPPAIPPNLRVGELVDAVGYQRWTGYGVMLGDARVQRVGAGQLPTPVDVTEPELMSGAFHARRVQMTARLISTAPRSDSGGRYRTLTLAEKDQYFDAILPATPLVTALLPGSHIKLTGVCEVEADSDHKPQSFRLLADETDAVALILSPPWWSPERIVAGGIGLILLTGAWTARVRHRMNRRRTELQRREVAAQSVREMNVQLETRVTERTRELQKSNQDLQREIEERHRFERIQQVSYRISEAVHSVPNLLDFYRQIHRHVETLMPAKNIFLLLENRPLDRHEFVYHVDERDPWPEPRKILNGPVGYILQTGKSLLIDRAAMTDPASAWGCTSGTPSAVWLGVPLVTSGRVIGVMALQDYHNPQAYGERDREVLAYVAAQTAVAIERQRARVEIERGEERLRASEQRFRQVFEGSPALMILTRFEDGRVVTVNNAFLEITGYVAAEVVGRLAAELNLYAVDQQRVEFRRLLRQHGVVQNREHIVRTKNGSVRTVLISAEVTQLDGEPHVLTVGQDISARKQAEQDMQRALAHAEELQEMKTRFVSLVSHEIRTPLGVTMSAVELLRNYRDRLGPEKQSELLNDIHGATLRMAGLMEQMLLLGRVESGKLVSRPVDSDLTGLGGKIVDESAHATQNKCPVTLVTRGDLSGARVDESLLRHILGNLLSNAVKYSPQGSPVRLEIERDGEDVLFVVSDSGIGIPLADQARLFEAFHRGSNVGETPGTGLGLLIVQRCVALLTGQLNFESQPNQGTRFTIRLPLFGNGRIAS